MKIKLEGVRLSFPAIWKAKSFSDGDGKETEPRYGATAILDKTKHKLAIKKLQDAIEKIAKDHFKGKVPGSLKRPLREGSEKDELDGYGDSVMFISASSKKRPVVVDRDMSPLTEDDDKPYGGCFVNMTFNLWVQDNKWGKRVNAQLRAIQFVKDGTPFGEKPVDADEEFESLEEQEEEEADEDDLLS